MTCRSANVRGSMADHDLLLAAFIAWRETQQASDLNWACHEEAAYADAARLDLQGHAIVCGYEPRHGDLILWAARRVNAYGRSIGQSPMEIAVMLGEFTEGGK